MQAGQCASRAFEDVNFLLDARRSLRGELKASKAEVQEAFTQIELLKGKVADSDADAAAGLEERDWLLKELKDLTTERDRLKEEKKLLEDDLPRQLEEAGDVGYNEAGEYYKEQVGHLVKMAFKDEELKGIDTAHASSFLCRYQVGLDYAEVPEADHRREPPVVPPVDLPEHLRLAKPSEPSSDIPPNPTDDTAQA